MIGPDNPSGVKVTKDELDKALRAVRRLTSDQVLVGIPEDKSDRGVTGETITNAQIAYINEFGSPGKNIPARPHMIPGVRATLPFAIERMKMAAVAALSGEKKIIAKSFTEIGLKAVNNIRSIIAAQIPPPLSPLTIARRLARTAKYKNASKVQRKAMMKQWMTGSFTPLLDTGNYWQHLTYVIRKKSED